jgi:hypothetical protein
VLRRSSMMHFNVGCTQLDSTKGRGYAMRQSASLASLPACPPFLQVSVCLCICCSSTCWHTNLLAVSSNQWA